MEKSFNVTGICIPKKHFMVDISQKINEIMKLIHREEYFIINKPRQFGKTTTMLLLEKNLECRHDYYVISLSFEGIGDSIFEDEEVFVKEFLDLLSDKVILDYEELGEKLKDEISNMTNLKMLSKIITQFIKKINKKVILMIDEVDKSSNNQVFISFLGMLRNKYLLRNAEKDYTFTSVILAGVHDVKSLKLKLRPDEERKYNSPWNIAADFKVDLRFSSEQIKTMLVQYEKEKKVKLDKEYFADRLFFYTDGYPFLVSKLCKIIDEEIMKQNLEWKKEYMDMAIKKLLAESNTNFDSLINNIEDNKQLFTLVKRIILNNEDITFSIDNRIIDLGMIYGILKEVDGKVKINNRIYEQRIYNYLSSILETTISMEGYNSREKYIKHNGDLDVNKVLIKFSEFMRHEYSEKRNQFLEHDGRMVFLAFINPILNGSGFAFKEVQGGDEKRLDITITYNKKMYIIELKIWRGIEYHRNGMIQLANYLDEFNLDEGHLLVFDLRKQPNETKLNNEQIIKVNNKVKKIYEVYC